MAKRNALSRRISTALIDDDELQLIDRYERALIQAFDEQLATPERVQLRPDVVRGAGELANRLRADLHARRNAL